jgi:glycosyltransferase involved in cell wall biosynthesis
MLDDCFASSFELKVSVCMAVYNGERFIEEQMASILPQLSYSDELIISDNWSTDRTQELITQFKDCRIKLIRNVEFTNLISNFENALKNASGDILFLADCDDIWKPTKVEAMKSLLGAYDLVVSDCEIIDAKGEVIADSFFASSHPHRGLIRNVIKNSYIGCCMAFKRRILELALPFPKNIPMHDVWIASLAELFGETHFCRERLMSYRRHGSNASTTGEKSKYSIPEKIGLRVRLMTSLLQRSIHRKLS